MKFILLTFLILTGPIANAKEVEGKEVGNGGGTICITEDHCVTLAQAGLEIDTKKEDFFPISKKLREKVKQLLKLSNIHPRVQDRIYKNVLGNTKTYVPVKTIDQSKLNQLLGAYDKAVDELDPDFNLKRFKVNAWSDSLSSLGERHTYLLPSFFELGLTIRAYLLIHEANVRNIRPSRLIDALRFDVYFYKLTTKATDFDNLDFDYVQYIRTLERLGLNANRARAVDGVIHQANLKNGFPLIPNQICKEPMRKWTEVSPPVKIYHAGCKASYEKLLDLYDLEPRLAMYLENRTIGVSGDTPRITEITSEDFTTSDWLGQEFKTHSDGGNLYRKYLPICQALGNDAKFLSNGRAFIAHDQNLPKFDFRKKHHSFGTTWLVVCKLQGDAWTPQWAQLMFIE